MNSPMQESETENTNTVDVDAFTHAADEQELGIVAEFLLFLKENKAWWLTPILLALLLIFVFAWLSTSVIAPFIYPLF